MLAPQVDAAANLRRSVRVAAGLAVVTIAITAALAHPWMGVFATVGHYLLIMAHRLAPPALLAPFIYSQIVWAIILGYLVFANVPNRWTLAGAAIVIASGLYILYREQK